MYGEQIGGPLSVAVPVLFTQAAAAAATRGKHKWSRVYAYKRV